MKTSSLLTLCVVATLLVGGAMADLYMHTPPGSNCRNRERNENRNNGNRMFDSQNNGKGGYPWRGNPTTLKQADPLTYYTGSIFRIEWTNQHSCGTNPNIVCDVVIQYACDTIEANLKTYTGQETDRDLPGLRDGYPEGNVVQSDGGNAGYTKRAFVTNTNPAQNADGTNTISTNVFSGDATKQAEYYYIGLHSGVQFGLHEGINHYLKCQRTMRNERLYLADQKLNNNIGARATRQNGNGNRRGLECPEERDYYPYWNGALNPWHDIAILTNDISKCEFFQENSPNVRSYGWCDYASTGSRTIPWDEDRCKGLAANGAVWRQALPKGGGKPDCKLHMMTRDNHLGNAIPVDDQGNILPSQFQPETAHYLWQIPDELADKRCIIRMRYNMSTLDYPSDQYSRNGGRDGVGVDLTTNCPRVNTNAAGVDDDGQTVDQTASQCTNTLTVNSRPLYNRPYVKVFGADASALSVAINTNQAGRTFQDRSYVFDVREAPVSGTIWNLNTRGRRGNIVQSYPSVEYDFVPSKLMVTQGDYIHIQFHGSDFNAERNANNGEGWRFSDRHNIVQLEDAAQNVPGHLDNVGLFKDHSEALYWGLLGQENCGTYKNGDTNEQNAIDNCGKLNRAPQRFPRDPALGLIKVRSDQGTYHYASTRNNNFSNRSQKGTIMVNPSTGLTAAQIAGITVGTTFGVGLILFGLCFYSKRNPDSKVGGCYPAVQNCRDRCGGPQLEGVAGGTSVRNTVRNINNNGGTTGGGPPDMEYVRH